MFLLDEYCLDLNCSDFSERGWKTFGNCYGCSERDIIKKASEFIYDDVELWKRNGKKITEMELYDWVQTGCESAVSVEELFALNPDLEIFAGTTSTSPSPFCTDIEFVRTTLEFDELLYHVGKQNFYASIMYDGRLNLPHRDPLYVPNKQVFVKIDGIMPLFLFSDEKMMDGAYYCVSPIPLCSFSEEDATDIAISYERNNGSHEFSFIPTNLSKIDKIVVALFSRSDTSYIQDAFVGVNSDETIYSYEARIFETEEEANDYIQEKIKRDAQFRLRNPAVARL